MHAIAIIILKLTGCSFLILFIFIVNTAIGDKLIESIKLRDYDKKILRYKTIHLLYLPDAAAAVGKSQ